MRVYGQASNSVSAGNRQAIYELNGCTYRTSIAKIAHCPFVSYIEINYFHCILCTHIHVLLAIGTHIYLDYARILPSAHSRIIVHCTCTCYMLVLFTSVYCYVMFVTLGHFRRFAIKNEWMGKSTHMCWLCDAFSTFGTVWQCPMRPNTTACMRCTISPMNYTNDTQNIGCSRLAIIGIYIYSLWRWSSQIKCCELHFNALSRPGQKYIQTLACCVAQVDCLWCRECSILLTTNAWYKCLITFWNGKC